MSDLNVRAIRAALGIHRRPSPRWLDNFMTGGDYPGHGDGRHPTMADLDDAVSIMLSAADDDRRNRATVAAGTALHSLAPLDLEDSDADKVAAITATLNRLDEQTRGIVVTCAAIIAATRRDPDTRRAVLARLRERMLS